jgi:two-component sensor histidine kinase
MQGAELSKGSAAMDRGEVRMLLEDVAARIGTIACLHRLLSEPARHAGIDLGTYLEEICESLVSSLTFAGSVTLTTKLERDCLVSPRDAAPLGLIVGEMVTNAIKHAHPTGVAGKLTVSCHREVDGMLVVEVSDDGVGLPEGFDPAVDGGLGLRLVRRLAAQLRARPVFHQTGVGLRFFLLVPALERSGEAVPPPVRSACQGR